MRIVNHYKGIMDLNQVQVLEKAYESLQNGIESFIELDSQE